ncbi:YaaC family protein [Xanthobacter autotrophicus]|uniref:YaaC family protein n=1 Tax=Xanthobacter autotrophicus TaxID=280 RepID=UPI0024A71C5E|nr:YaaC family protein [Xanthobacter autotrophicus]MDI4659204.1 YaaC family protein [Xanthobacter autotrophicus]
MAGDWYDIKFLESTVNITAVVKRSFGREPNAAVARDITVSIQQGRLFFEAAADAPLQIKPLLVYYGILSFARSLTAAIKNDKLISLEQGHGLKDVGAPNCIDNLMVSVQRRGTFKEFNDAIAPLSRFNYFENSMHKSASKPFETVDGLIGKNISIVDILSRIPSLNKIYFKTYKNHPKSLFIDYHKIYNSSTIRVDDPFIAKTRGQLHQLMTRLRAHYPFLQAWRLDSAQVAWDSTVLIFYNSVFDHDDLSEESLIQLQGGSFQAVPWDGLEHSDPVNILPPMAGGFDKGAYHCAIQPIGSVTLNEYSLQFLGVYLLGSLVRYRPQIWQHAISKSVTATSPADDRSLMLVEKFIDDVLISFPKLIVNLMDMKNNY